MGDLQSTSEAQFPVRRRDTQRRNRPTHHAGNGLVDETTFSRVLSLERKRAERSRKLLLLMLLDVRGLLDRNLEAAIIHKLTLALASLIRETDVHGWYKTNDVLGLLFTELNGGDKTVLKNTMLARIQAALAEEMSPELVRWIHISLHFFPEDWDAEKPGRKMNSVLYPDHDTNEHARRHPQAVKRVIDVIGSAIGLVLLFPIFLLAAILIKLTSKGTVLYRQKRVGRYGVTFDMLKFRTMRAASDSTIHKQFVQKLIAGDIASGEQADSDAPVFKLKSDPRITPIGKLLRKMSADELPQLWNVLRGEMSLVGPRPPIPYELECYDFWHRRRLLEARPGITGLWQVNGRSRTSFDDMVRLDLKYARTWSLWLDFKILLKTPLAVLSGEGAY